MFSDLFCNETGSGISADTNNVNEQYSNTQIPYQCLHFSWSSFFVLLGSQLYFFPLPLLLWLTVPFLSHHLKQFTTQNTQNNNENVWIFKMWPALNGSWSKKKAAMLSRSLTWCNSSYFLFMQRTVEGRSHIFNIHTF